MDIITLIVVGLVAGLLAAVAVGGVGYGIIGDIAIGIAGAFIGNWLFGALRLSVPIGGLGGTILVAFVGSVVLLVILRAVNRGRTRAKAI